MISSARDFARADREIESTAAAVTRAIERLLNRTAKLESVAPDYVIERLFLTLLREHDFVQLFDRMAPLGPATMQLSNALHDYRDAQSKDR